MGRAAGASAGDDELGETRGRRRAITTSASGAVSAPESVISRVMPDWSAQRSAGDASLRVNPRCRSPAPSRHPRARLCKKRTSVIAVTPAAFEAGSTFYEKKAEDLFEPQRTQRHRGSQRGRRSFKLNSLRARTNISWGPPLRMPIRSGQFSVGLCVSVLSVVQKGLQWFKKVFRGSKRSSGVQEGLQGFKKVFSRLTSHPDSATSRWHRAPPAARGRVSQRRRRPRSA